MVVVRKYREDVICRKKASADSFSLTCRWCTEQGGRQCDEALTEVGVLAQLGVKALKALSSPPAIVPSSHDYVHLLVAVLAHISTEYTAPAMAICWVTAVHRAAPHVPYTISIHFWSCLRVPQEGVVSRDPVGEFTIHIQAKDFPQESRPAVETWSPSLEKRTGDAPIQSFGLNQDAVLTYFIRSVIGRLLLPCKTVQRFFCLSSQY